MEVKIRENLKNISLKMEEFFYPLVGLPSYKKYLDSHKLKHPNCHPQSREEFYREAFERRYGKDGAKKCC